MFSNVLMYCYDKIYGNNRIEIVQMLINNGINLNEEDSNGYTLLMQRVDKLRKENLEPEAALDFLINSNIEIHYKSSKQLTAMTIAVCEGKTKLADYLMKQGAKRDPEAEWWYMATKRGRVTRTIDKVRQLIAEGVDVNLQMPVAVLN